MTYKKTVKMNGQNMKNMLKFLKDSVKGLLKMLLNLKKK